MPRSCGSCNLCCKLLGVPDIGKPSGMTCWWTTIHGGCKRHEEKPDPAKVTYNEETSTYSLDSESTGKDLNLLACAQFRCLWLESQNEVDPSHRQPRIMRPDITHVVIGPQDPKDETLLYIQVDPSFPDAWRQDPVATFLNDILADEGKIEVMMGGTSFKLLDPFL